MGTNFYLRRKISEEKKNTVKNLIDSDNWYEASEILNECTADHNVHIGKRSCGWKFLWNANNFKYFKPDKGSICAFLMTGDIIDEYGQIYTYDQFFNDEIKNWIGDAKNKDGSELWDAVSYAEFEHKRNPNYRDWLPSQDAIGRFEIEHGVKVNIHGEFYIDDWRFTIHDEFC